MHEEMLQLGARVKFRHRDMENFIDAVVVQTNPEVGSYTFAKWLTSYKGAIQKVEVFEPLEVTPKGDFLKVTYVVSQGGLVTIDRIQYDVPSSIRDFLQRQFEAYEKILEEHPLPPS